MIRAIRKTVFGLFLATLFIGILLYLYQQQQMSAMEVITLDNAENTGVETLYVKEIKEMMEQKNAQVLEQVEEIKETPVERTVEFCGKEIKNSVEEININELPIEDFQKFQDELAQFYQLKEIEMCHTGLSDEKMDELCKKFPETKFIWTVHCGNFEIRTDAVAFSTMFTGYGWDPMTEDDFKPLQYCKDLEALDIGHHSMRDISFLKDLKKLKILIIAINRLDDISTLSELKNLTYLELFLNDIHDLTPLEGLVNLEHLNLCHNKNLGDIEPILHYQNLKRLWISYCNLSKEEIEKIRKAYPDAELEFQVYESVEAGWRSTDVYVRMRNVFNHNEMDEMFLPKVNFYEETTKKGT